MKKSEILKTTALGFLVCIFLAFIIINLFGLHIGLLLGQRDYEAITSLEKRFNENPTDTKALDLIIKRTESKNDLTRANAIAVLASLSSERSHGKSIHKRSIPVFLDGLSDETQSVVKVSLQGLSNLGVYAVEYIPEIMVIANEHEDPYLRDRAKDALESLQESEKRANNASKRTESTRSA
jgi:HEAT repeat protein